MTDYRTERLVEMKGKLRDDLHRQLIRNYSSTGFQPDRVVVEYAAGEDPIWVLCHEVIPNFPLGPCNPRLLGKWILPTLTGAGGLTAGEWIQGKTIEEEEAEAAQAIEVERKRFQHSITFTDHMEEPIEVRSLFSQLAPAVQIHDPDVVRELPEDPRLFLAVDLPLWLAIWRGSEEAEHFCPEELVTLFSIVEGQAADNEGDSREVQEMWSPETYVENWKSVTKQDVEDVAGQEFLDCQDAADWVGGYIVHHDNGPTILVNAEDFGQLAEERIRELTADRLGGEA